MTARTNWASIARRITTKKQTKSLLKVQYSFESSAITDSKQDAIINIRTQKEATPDPADDFTMHNERLLTTETIYYHYYCINDEIEIYDGKWRTTTIVGLKRANQKFPMVAKLDKKLTEKYTKNERRKLQAIQVSTKNNNTKWIIIDPDSEQNKDQFNHHIGSDNAPKSIGSFISSAEQILVDELLFYEKCSSYWNKIKQNENMDVDDTIMYHTHKYNRFMMKIAKFINIKQNFPIKKGTKSSSNYICDEFFSNNATDINIIYFWRIHMMHPVLYNNDCMKHFGFLLSPLVHDIITNVSVYDSEHVQKYDESSKTSNRLFTTFKFAKSLSNNIVFMGNVLRRFKDYDINYYISDYQDFLYFSSCFANKSKEYNMPKVRLAPKIMCDFVWHTHLMFPNVYNEECPTYTHRNIILDHTDLIVDHLPFSAKFWEFIVDYAYIMTSGYHPNFKENLGDMVCEALNTDRRNSLLVYGYLAKITGYCLPGIANICLEYVNKTTKWSIQVSRTPSIEDYDYDYGCCG